MNKIFITFAVFSIATFSLMGCEKPPQADSTYSQLDFKPIQVSAEAKKYTLHSEQVSINGEQQKLNYQTLFKTGDKNNGERFGLLKDVSGEPLKLKNGADYICNGTNEGLGSGLDHVSILHKNNKLFLVSQYECVIGAFYINELQQSSSGELKVKPNSLKFIDQSSENGGFNHCAGMTTPWQSHLASEEYEPNARAVEANFDIKAGLTGMPYYDELKLYWQGELSRSNPYFYGWIPEIKIDNQGNPSYEKHYSMGRLSHEIAYVMPDQKTVYMTDDGTNGGLYLFIADQAQDLSSGHLFAAKWIQTSNEGLGEAILHWADLGKTTDQAIRKVVNQKLQFSDIFNTSERDANQNCPSTYRSVNTMFGAECLALKDVNKDGQISRTDEVIAARLETRRMAGYLGATTEFRKSEGLTFNPQSNKLYLAISEVSRGMENFAKNGKPNNKYDLGGANDIQLQPNRCGAIYQLSMTKSREMKSDYIATSIKGLIAGKPVKNELNRCDLNNIANPDNLTYLDNSNSLVIAEDTAHHQNNLVWSYDIDANKLTPILSAPVKAENTSIFWHKDLNGYGYLTSVAQHPLKNKDVPSNKKQSSAAILGPFNFQQY